MNDLLHPRHKVECESSPDLVSRLLNIAPMICPRQGGGFGRGLGFDSFIFYRKIISCLLKRDEIWKEGKLKH